MRRRVRRRTAAAREPLSEWADEASREFYEGFVIRARARMAGHDSLPPRLRHSVMVAGTPSLALEIAQSDVGSYAEAEALTAHLLEMQQAMGVRA